MITIPGRLFDRIACEAFIQDLEQDITRAEIAVLYPIRTRRYSAHYTLIERGKFERNTGRSIFQGNSSALILDYSVRYSIPL